MKLLKWMFGFLVFLAPCAAWADYLMVTHDAYLYASPDSHTAQLQRLPEGAQLTLLDEGTEQRGYYHAETADGQASGWVYRTMVRREAGTLPAQVPANSGSPAVLDNRVVSDLCAYGCPNGASPHDVLLIREIYILSNNPVTKFADWVAYRIDAKTIKGASTDRKWLADPLLPADETLVPNDYTDANKALHVDRGHQAPLADFRGTPFLKMTNFLSNITPQATNLNQGAWVKLEDQERVLAKTTTVYVMTGPLYQKSMPPLPNSHLPHQVPSGYWKIIVIPGKNPKNTQTAAFMFPQDTPRNADFRKYLTTIDAVEDATKLNFLWRLDDQLEKTIESRTNEQWVKADFPVQ